MSHHDSPRAFTCFSQLPLELRRRIWSYARPSRLISVYPEIIAPSLTWNVQIEAATIPIAQVSKEARAEGLRGYTKFPCKMAREQSTASHLRVYLQSNSLWQPQPPPPSSSHDMTHLYINFSLDTIYLEYSLDMPSFDIATRFLGAELEKVRHFALDFEYCAFDMRSYQKLHSLPRINEPIFVVTELRYGLVRCGGKFRPSLSSLEGNYCRPGQDFPFRFMFSDLSENSGGSFGEKLKEHGFKTRLAERHIIQCDLTRRWNIKSDLLY